MKSKLIALSAISAGFIAVLLTLGAYIEFVDLFAVVFTAVFVIIPLYYNSYKASFLTYLVGGCVAFILSGFNFLSIVFPAYIAFFGLYPIIKCLMQEKKLNKIFTFIFGLVWTIIAVYGIYFYYVLVMKQTFAGLPVWVESNIFLIIGLFSVVFYLVFDRFVYVIRLIINRYLGRIIK